MSPEGLGCDINKTLSTHPLLLLLELVGLEGLEMTELTERFVVEITRFIDGARGMGVSRLVPLPLEQNYLIWGVSFICSVVFIS